jgi:hypothetical protein
MRYERVLAATLLFGGCGWGCSAASDSPSSEDAAAIEQAELSHLEAGLRSLAGDKVTRFSSAEELAAKRAELDREYRLDKAKGKALRAELGTLGDLVRPQEALTLAALGQVYVSDTSVFSTEQLMQKARTKLAALHEEEPGPDGAREGSEHVGTTAQALTGKSWQSEDRQYPYKMIGTSYHDTTWVEGEVGAKTEFQKHREKYWWLGKRWYGLDADHLSVRSVVFKNNSAIDAVQDSDSNDDVVSVTANWCVAKPTGSDITCGAILNPYGVHSFHAVDHGSSRFRVETANNVSDGANYNGYTTGYDIAW